MAGIAAAHVELVTALREFSATNSIRVIRQYPEFSALYDAYLAKFGDRCLEELKLESPTLHDDPLLLLRSVGQLARRLAACGLATQSFDESQLRRAAEARVKSALRFRPVRRLLFRWVLRNARESFNFRKVGDPASLS